MSKLIQCPVCGNSISVNATSCPSCGEPIAEQVSHQIQSEKAEKISKLLARKKRNKSIFVSLMAICFIVFIVLPILSNFGGVDMEELKKTDPDKYEQLMKEKAKKEKEEAERLAAQKKEEAEDRRAGFHCLSPWDGSHRRVSQQVEEMMREPDSFEHIETRISPVNSNGNHNLVMTYRARNGFGGMSIGKATAIIKNSNCEATILSTE
ncbi:hypothetical protein [Sneathiella litorea]|uniref:Zinc-ribbon domain-containing protein n=1 Tax=Sneathiella litorea TaxID=2606216 RepID=A0A6L8W568_9PROT|nr:hypothetical protein [Sneathiella litorea]MZR30238.1 hypothetical protein [Sneathiella litorea]